MQTSTKTWTTQDGRVRHRASIDKKYLSKLLRNRIYLGELSHKGSWYPGTHPAIIDTALWEQVRAVLAKDSHARSWLMSAQRTTRRCYRRWRGASTGSGWCDLPPVLVRSAGRVRG